ncbi:hypothetical protein NADE_009273 [Nannochloris sp. 'desiccata']|nr:hypothetical protein KSW81_005979 [Chlorella desiccata (nom. nud.)]KAH7621227.1 hypothetical protein NADE_009273 [Chlorella desiccata (nom. nud.)]
MSAINTAVGRDERQPPHCPLPKFKLRLARPGLGVKRASKPPGGRVIKRKASGSAPILAAVAPTNAPITNPRQTVDPVSAASPSSSIAWGTDADAPSIVLDDAMEEETTPAAGLPAPGAVAAVAPTDSNTVLLHTVNQMYNELRALREEVAASKAAAASTPALTSPAGTPALAKKFIYEAMRDLAVVGITLSTILPSTPATSQQPATGSHGTGSQ